MMEFKDKVKKVLDRVGNLLIAKNKSYGDTALNPVHVFSKLDSREALYCRIDDKLARIKAQESFDREDTIEDLIGYLVLLKTLDLEDTSSNCSVANSTGRTLIDPIRLPGYHRDNRYY